MLGFSASSGILPKNVPATQFVFALIAGLAVAIAVPNPSTAAPLAAGIGGQIGPVNTEMPQGRIVLAHCCHPHPLPPYDNYCCHSGGAYVYAPGGYAGSVRRQSRRVSRRTSRRVSRRR